MNTHRVTSYFDGFCQRRGGTLAIFIGLCLCQRRGWNSGYIHSFVLVPEKGWNSGYIHSFVLVPEKGWNSGYIHSFVLVPEKGWNLAIFIVSSEHLLNIAVFLESWKEVAPYLGLFSADVATEVNSHSEREKK